MKLARVIYGCAGIYGLLVLLPQYFLEATMNRLAPPAITHPEFYYGFIGVAVAWQVMFLLIAYDPKRYRPVMLVSLIEKFSFAGAAVVLLLQWRLSWMMFGAAMLDAVWGCLFVAAYRAMGQWDSKAEN